MFSEFKCQTKCNLGLQPIPLSTILKTEYREPDDLIEGLLPVGTYVFAGEPKVGKSYLMLQLAVHVALGKDFWGYVVKQGTVLYLSLEDTEARIQRRFRRMFGEQLEMDNVYIQTDKNVAPLGDGLEQQLREFISENPDTRLIIIDTLQKVRRNNKGGTYKHDYEIIASLKKIGDENDICIFIVHHTRKTKANDVFHMISGSQGLLGAADGGIVLRKSDRCDTFGYLHITGRDVSDMKCCIFRDEETNLWELQEIEEGHDGIDPIVPIIGEYFNENMPKETVWFGTAKRLIDQIPALSDVLPNRLCIRLKQSDKILRERYGIYFEKKKRQGKGRFFALSFKPDGENMEGTTNDTAVNR